MKYYCQHYKGKLHYMWDSDYAQSDIDENIESSHTTVELTKEQFELGRIGLGKIVSGSFEEIVIPTLTVEEETLLDLRNARDRELTSCDWTQVPDSPLSDSKKAEWATYRQALRDLPSTYSYDSSKFMVYDYLPTKPS